MFGINLTGLVYFLAIGIVVTNIKIFPIRELSYPGHRINSYCEAILS